MPKGDILNETVGDLEIPGRDIIYPLDASKLKTLTYKYDFHIKKKDSSLWVYVDSCDTLRRWKNHKKATVEGGGRWRIIESKTATVIQEGGNEDV
jgi:hypothetical protein